MRDDANHFWSLVDRSGNCWLWMGPKHPSGYGVYAFEHRTVMAHRVALMLSTGSFPLPGFVVMHLCNNKQCVNPAHLSVGSQSDNARSAWADGLHPTPPETVSMSLRFPSDMYQSLKEIAKAEGRSINRQLVYFIRQAKERDEAAAASDRTG
jgi:hypothetical protein